MNSKNLILIAFFLSGFAALVYEVVFAKALILIIGTSIYAYSIMLSAFLLGMGLGSILVQRLIGKIDSVKMFIYIELGIGAYAVIFIPMLTYMDKVYLFMHNLAASNFFIFSVMLVSLSFLILLIPALLMGMTFPVVSDILAKLKSIGKDMGKLFSVNTLGGVIGAFVAGFIFLPTLGIEKTIYLAAAVNVLISLVIFLDYKKKSVSKKSKKNYSISFAVVVILGIILSNVRIDPFTIGVYYKASQYQNLSTYNDAIANSKSVGQILFSDYGVYGSVVVKEQEGAKYLLTNGKTDAGTAGDVPTQFLVGYIPMMLNENPKKVGIVGLGSGFTLSAVENFDIEFVDQIEINPSVIEAAKHFSEENENALDDDRLNLIVADARNYLLTSKNKYDVIISEPSNPWMEGEGFLFTKEYYEIINSRLNENGVLSQWIGAYDFEPEDFKVLLRTISSVFEYVQVWNVVDGADFIVIASNEPVDRDYMRIENIFENKEIYRDFQIIAQFTSRQVFSGPDLFFSFYLADNEFLDGYMEGRSLNTDNKPIIEFETGKNRIRDSDNNLIALLEYMGENSTNTVINPNVKNLLDISKGQIDFLELEFGMDDLELLKTDYLFEYIKLSKNSIFTNVRMLMKKTAVFADGEKQLFIHASPQLSMTSKSELEEVAQILKSKITSEISDGNISRYEFENDFLIGMTWFCEEKNTLYIAYYSYPGNTIVEDKSKMEDDLLSLNCI
ncbi:spermidine synthase [Bacteroidota bacterium]